MQPFAVVSESEHLSYLTPLTLALLRGRRPIGVQFPHTNALSLFVG